MMLSTQYAAPEDKRLDLQQDETCTIAKAMRGIHIPEEHERTTKFDSKVSKGHARTIEGVEILQGIVLFTMSDLVNTGESELFPRKFGKDGGIDIINSVILGGEDGAVQEILIRVWKGNVRV
jgi:hypothetical protein